jgi:hypothetical protein
VRAKGDPAALVPAVRTAVREGADPDVPLQDVTTLGEKVTRAAAPQRFNARVVSAFGIAALLLALLGLYGLLAFAVERCAEKIGVRLSQGARGGVVRLVAGRGSASVARPPPRASATTPSPPLPGPLGSRRLATYAIAGFGFGGAPACLVPALRARSTPPAQSGEP